MNPAAEGSAVPGERVASARRPIRTQLLAIVAAFATGFILFLALVVLSFRMATGVRAYIAGEGLWSKGQKDAVYYLQRYVRTHDPGDFDKYRAAVAIPLGDRIAREELQKPRFDPDVATRGFLQGLNDPADIPSMIFLFREFHRVAAMRRAIETWTAGDAGIAELEQAAAALHAEIGAGRLDAAGEAAFLDRIEAINDRLTPLAREFSQTLGTAARRVRDLVFAAVVGAATLLLTGALVVSWFIARRLQRGLTALAAGVARVERGNLDHPIVLQSQDELGELATAFNEMMAHRRTAERDLRRRAEELARSNAELEQFAYVASHDLQEPLRTVASYAQLLVRRAQGRLGPESEEYVRHISEAVARMRGLIDDLLRYSRATRAEESRQPADLSRLLGQALANLESAVAAEKAQVTHDPLPTLPVVPHLVVQLFQNLVGNALKFRGDAAPRIHVGATRRESDWEFSVRDNGIGIEPQHAERIFMLFQRLHPRDRYPGSGLGLAICKKIVEQQGGRIWIESAAAGADIRFTLPAVAN